MMIKNITFTLENCEQITFDGKWIGDFMMDNIHSYIGRAASNWIGETQIADTVLIEIHKNANESYEVAGNKTTKFERLARWADITHIDFELYDQYHNDENSDPLKKSYCFLVSWEEDNDGCVNKLQKNYVSSSDHLYILIDKKSRKISDFIEMEEIEDEESMHFKFQMYGIEDFEE